MWGNKLRKLQSAFLQRRELEPRRNTDGKTNGEFDLLRLIASSPDVPKGGCVVDVGANVGNWTNEALARFESIGISDFFCIEPIPSYAEKLRLRFMNRASVQILETALSDSVTKPIQMYEVGAKEGRLYWSYRDKTLMPPAAPSKRYRIHRVNVTTGDVLFAGHRPLFIKIDCEGHDLHILRGFELILRKERPLVQFEYCEFWLANDATLKEACGFLDGLKYTTYKLFPDSLREFTFSWPHETFGYQNIVAVPKDSLFLRGDRIPLKPETNRREP